jgi:hypothetical protein
LQVVIGLFYCYYFLLEVLNLRTWLGSGNGLGAYLQRPRHLMMVANILMYGREPLVSHQRAVSEPSESR